nr:hypothetical protein [uncultured Dysosmobacter sp.]
MAEFREIGSDEKTEVLKWILSQSHRARKKKAQLVERLERIRAESSAPVHTSGFSSMPKTRRKNTAVENTVITISEIEDRILQQQRHVEKSIIKVMDLLDILPEKSLEREICELYHIDDKSWPTIQAEIPMSRSQCYKRYNNALDIMLSDQRAQAAVEEGLEEYRAYKALENRARKKQGAQNRDGGGARGRARRPQRPERGA